MKKILTILFLSFLLTGCSINYNLDIGDEINENLEFEVTESDYDKYNNSSNEVRKDNLYKFLDYQPIFAFNDSYSVFHKSEKNNIKDGLKLNYSYVYDYSNYGKSYILDTCFDDYSVVNDDNYYYVKVSGKMDCYYGETNINLKTTKKVAFNNADSYKDGVFTWKINSKNKNNVDISFQLSKNKSFDETNIYKTKKSVSYVYTIVIFILILISIVGLIFIKKKGIGND